MKLNKKLIGWVFFLITCFSLIMTFVMAYFPPPNEEPGNIASFMAIPLFIVSAIYLFSAYGD